MKGVKPGGGNPHGNPGGQPRSARRRGPTTAGATPPERRGFRKNREPRPPPSVQWGAFAMHRLVAILAALLLAVHAAGQEPARGPAAEVRPLSAPARAAVLTFGEKDADMVGFFVTADAFRACIPMLKEEKVDTVVVRFRSGGGAYAEVEKFSDLFHNEFKKDFRLVAWVDEALSAAAMSAHSIEEICFTPKGNYGACTGFSGRLDQGTSRRAVQKSLQLGEMISARGKHHPQIMRAMQISSEAEECEAFDLKPPYGALSATVDPASGEIRFFPDAKLGPVVLNPKGGVHILTLDADEALKIRFSKGTASTLGELEKVLGPAKVEWVGERTGEAPWPICKAERSLMEGRRRFAAAVKELEPLAKTLNERLSKAESAAPADRTGLVADARGVLDRLNALVTANPTLMLLYWGGEEEYGWFIEGAEKELSKLEPARAQPAAKPEAPHTPRAAVLTFGDEKYGDMVGIYETAQSFRECIPLLKEEKVEIVVVRVKCGGGLLVEIPRLADLFHDEFKPKFRTVAWIDSAISAGAMSVHSIEEMYFTPDGNYGACFGRPHTAGHWNGGAQILSMMDRISALGRHHPQIMRAMMFPSKKFAEENDGKPPYGDLSATVDATSGEVRLFADSSGALVLNPKGGVHILTLDAESAKAIRFSRETASTLDELAKAMNLPQVEWVGEKSKEYAWPVCKAERHLLEFRMDARAGETSFTRAVVAIRGELDAAIPDRSSERTTRLERLGRSLSTVRARVASNENWMLIKWGDADEYHKWLGLVERRLAEAPSPDGKQDAK